MQPSRERDASEGDPLDDLDDLLDDDLRDGDASSDRADPGNDASTGDRAIENRGTGERGTGDRGTGDRGTGTDGRGRLGVDGRWFSLKSFAVAVLAVGLGALLGGMIPLIGGTIGAAAGVFLGAFLVGLALSGGRYAETGLAGAGIGVGAALVNVLGVGFLPIGIRYLSEWGLPLLAAGGGIGLLLSVVGHYFGRDLRAGLTGDVPE